jgi:hypothetical protein
MLVPLGNTPFACSYELLTVLARNLRRARPANTGGRLVDRVLAVNLEDVPRDNDGPQRSATVSPGFGMTRADGSDQHRLDAWSLDGMQGISALGSVGIL